jgi:predicted amidohydrolase YtcJ
LRHCFRELNRVGLTSIGDLQDSSVTFAHRRMLSAMAQDSELTVRVNFFIQPEQSGDELEQLKRALEEVKQLSQSELFRFAGFGAILRPGKGKTARTTKDLALGAAAKEWLRLIEFFARSRHDFQIEALGDAAMPGVLDVIETVHRQAPLGSGRIGFTGLNDAAPQTVARIKKFGGIIVQGLELQTGGRIFERVGQSPGRGNLSPRALLEAGVPLGAGSDGFYSGNYSPMLALWGLVTGKDIGGAPSRDIKHNLTRLEALRVHTLGSAWFTGDEHKKGSLEPGKFADLVVLTEDYLTIPEDRIAALESLLTMVGGRVVHAAGPFARTR